MLEQSAIAYISKRISAADGYPLQARFYYPKTMQGGVLIVPAMGVPQSFYSSFAQWLSQQGFLAVTFDYRGIGDSLYGAIKKVEADIDLWAHDTAAILAELRWELSDKPLVWIGHSLGGQIIPLVSGFETINKIITIAAGNGYWKLNAARLKYKSLILWYGIVPVTVRLFGYFPGKRLGMIGNLPAGSIRQWRQYCLRPNYIVSADRVALYDAVTQPLNVIYFSDDEMLAPQSIESMTAFYRYAAKSMHLIDPQQRGIKRIGHMGFFRDTMQAALWEQTLKPLLI